MGRIFISYRRSDWAFAQRLAEHLEVRLPFATIVLDIRIETDVFPQFILSEIQNCDIFILVSSESTFPHKRIHHPEDWIRKEIREALIHNRPIIIASIGEVRIPTDLPADISGIGERNGIPFYATMFPQCVEQLANRCIKLAPSAFSIAPESYAVHLAKPITKAQTGIIATYDNLDACADAMRKDFRDAKDIRLLLQLGRKELGDGRNSLFYEVAKEKKHPDEQIRVLRASEGSPFLSEKRAQSRGQTTYEEWLQAIDNIAIRIKTLSSSHGVNIKERPHHEPFLWRIFIFDDIAYASGYIFTRRNDQNAVVHKIEKGENSLFGVFDKYFEYLWEKYDPSDQRSETEKWISW